MMQETTRLANSTEIDKIGLGVSFAITSILATTEQKKNHRNISTEERNAEAY